MLCKQQSNVKRPMQKIIKKQEKHRKGNYYNKEDL